MNPTLISGFEDVITHINQQEQRVMGLEEENKKLKEENVCGEDVGELEEYLESMGAVGGALKTQHERDFYKKKVEKLKEENEKLEAKVLLLQSSEEGLEKKLDTGGWSPTSSPEPKQ
jgi:cell division protein FtsB